jgi:hypothetical protein
MNFKTVAVREMGHLEMEKWASWGRKGKVKRDPPNQKVFFNLIIFLNE